MCRESWAMNVFRQAPERIERERSEPRVPYQAPWAHGRPSLCVVYKKLSTTLNYLYGRFFESFEISGKQTPCSCFYWQKRAPTSITTNNFGCVFLANQCSSIQISRYRIKAYQRVYQLHQIGIENPRKIRLDRCLGRRYVHAHRCIRNKR